MSSCLAELATLDDSYDGCDPSILREQEERDRMLAGTEHNLKPPDAWTPEKLPPHLACDSSSNIVPVHDTTSRKLHNLHIKSPSRSSPFYWNLPSQLSTLEKKRTRAVQNSTIPTKFWHGWKVILFGSCMCTLPLSGCQYPNCAHELTLTSSTGLNVLLVIIPISVRSKVIFEGAPLAYSVA